MRFLLICDVIFCYHLIGALDGGECPAWNLDGWAWYPAGQLQQLLDGGAACAVHCGDYQLTAGMGVGKLFQEL